MLALFTLTITVSAFLLFLIQPMIAKLIMPHLGGAPTVWNTAMLFFQACLLCGYAYAHAGTRWLKPRQQIVLHLVLVLASLSVLPLMLHVPEINAAHQPIRWMLLALALSVGFPFLMLSASAPLLQHWFALNGHRLSHNPYPLYAASNAGSFAALFAFPLLVEPFLSSGGQTDGWSWSYAVYLLLLGGCMAVTWKHAHQPRNQQEMAPPVPWRRRLHWIALAAIPSSLMLGVTSYISTDIAAVPLLWILPLALYLASFIFAFGGSRDFYQACVKVYLPIVALMLVMTISAPGLDLTIFIAHLFGFFIIAMLCHGQLNELKPHPSRLTGFYLCMAAGGVIGGLFNGLIAPVMMRDIYEYPLVLVVAAFVHPAWRTQGLTKRNIVLAALFICALVLYYNAADWLRNTNLHAEIAEGNDKRGLDWIIYLIVVATGLWFLRTARLSFGVGLVAVYATSLIYVSDDVLFQERNFFGVSRVKKNIENNLHEYYHGTTLHGIQSLGDDLRMKPVAYYWPLREIIDSIEEPMRSEPFGVLGLGAGTVQCYAQPDQQFDYFEIDPIVLQIANDPRYFTYLRDCPGTHDVYLGDGRVEIGKMDDARYRLIVLDAYSSDSLPVHLLTREAIALYRAKLKPGGLLMFNISNRHMNLRPILANIARDLDMQMAVKGFAPEEPLAYAAIWVAMSDDAQALAQITTKTEGWQKVAATPTRTWSDDYSNILHAFSFTQGWFYDTENDTK